MRVRSLWLAVLVAASVAVAAGPALAGGRKATSLWDRADGTDNGTSAEDEAGKDPAPGGPGTSGLLGQSLAAVLVILALGGAALLVVKRLLPRLGVTQGRQINVLETVYLGPRKTLYMVRVGDRTLLVSGTRERLSLLTDVTGSVEAPPPAEGEALRPTARFEIPGPGVEDS